MPWSRKWQPTPVFLAENSCGQRSLAGYSPWACKESEATEQLNNNKIKIKEVLEEDRFSFTARDFQEA